MIDAVYTWVDGSDPEWLEKKNAFLEKKGSVPENSSRSSTADSRFCNRDELKYSLRSLEKFAPFLNRIFVVTDNQTPSWLQVPHEKIQLVSHQEIFPDPNNLPTFNSHAIEANLHRIAGLSEQFIYLNDDFAFFTPVSEADFFDQQGRSLIYFDHRKVHWQPWWFGYSAPVNTAARNNSHLLSSIMSGPIRHRLDHVPYALNRSVIEELWNTFPEELQKTSAHKFRHPEDLSVVSSLAQHFALATGRAIQGPMDTNHYVKVKKYPFDLPLVRLQLARLKKTRQRRKFLSINDAGKLDDSESTQRAIIEFFEYFFPHQSRYEKPLT